MITPVPIHVPPAVNRQPRRHAFTAGVRPERRDEGPRLWFSVKAQPKMRARARVAASRASADDPRNGEQPNDPQRKTASHGPMIRDRATSRKEAKQARTGRDRVGRNRGRRRGIVQQRG